MTAALDRQITKDGKSLDILPSIPPPRLRGVVEIGFDGGRHSLVRSSFLLPSNNRLILSLGVTNLQSIAAALVLSIVLAFAFAVGCSRHVPPATEQVGAARTTAAANPSGSPPAVTTPTTGATLPPPVRITVLQDKTGSSGWTRTPVLSDGELRQLIDICRKGGGELTFGLIRDDSNRLLVRFTVDPPPIAPSEARASSTNVLEREEEEEKAHAAYLGVKQRYDAEYAAWNRIAESREAAFLSDADRLLAQAPDAKSTDVFGAVERADVALAESDAAFGRPTHRYLLLVSDCEHNVRRKKPIAQLRSGATVVVVNGVGSRGSLAGLKPLCFENVDAAIRWIGANESAARNGGRPRQGGQQ